MLLKPLALAAAAAAFMIIPKISEDDEDMFRALPIEPEPEPEPKPFQLSAEALRHSLDIPYGGSRADRYFELDLAVSDDRLKLLVNGVGLHTPPHGSMLREYKTMAPVVGGYPTAPVVLGYSLSLRRRARDEEQQMEVVDLVLQVSMVDGMLVGGIPAVDVSLVKATTTGEIIIVKAEVQEPAEAECITAACRTKTMVGDAWNGVKGLTGCGRHGPGPQKHGKHHGHDERPTIDAWKLRHNWRQYLQDIVLQIVLPILTGITAGVGVALFTMFTCSLVYRLGSLARGEGQRSPDQRYPTAEEEKGDLMGAEDAQDVRPAFPQD